MRQFRVGPSYKQEPRPCLHPSVDSVTQGFSTFNLEILRALNVEIFNFTNVSDVRCIYLMEFFEMTPEYRAGHLGRDDLQL